MSPSQGWRSPSNRLLLPLFIGVIIAALVMIRLGFWQLDRRAQRLERNARITTRSSQPVLHINGPLGDPTSAEYRHAIVEGTFDYDNEVIVIGRARGDAPGLHLLTPLRLAGGNYAVLVDRGWIPYSEREPAARTQYRGPEQAALRGRIMRPFGAAAGMPATQPRRDAWARVDVAGIQAQMPYQLLPFYVEQLPEPGETGLPWRGAEIVLDEGSHLSYAIQWFSFAVILLGGFFARVVLVARRRPTTAEAPGSS